MGWVRLRKAVVTVGRGKGLAHPGAEVALPMQGAFMWGGEMRVVTEQHLTGAAWSRHHFF